MSFVSIYTRIKPSDWAANRKTAILLWFCCGSAILILLTTTLAYIQQQTSEKSRDEALRASELTRNEVTGGNSFPQLTPQFSSSLEAAVPLGLFVKGEYALSGMWIAIRCDTLRAPPRHPLGTLPPGQWIEATVLMPLRDCERAIPDPTGEGMFVCDVDISARNGLFRELIQLKVVNRCKFIEFRYTLFLQDDFQLLDKGKSVGA